MEVLYSLKLYPIIVGNMIIFALKYIYFIDKIKLILYPQVRNSINQLTLRYMAAMASSPLCVQMDFTRTFQANAKCNNINYVWSQFYKILVVLKYHRRPWVNIFDTSICRSINIPKKSKYTTLMQIFMHLKMSVSKILAQGRLWYFKTTKNW